jgi:hypothetical protein
MVSRARRATIAEDIFIHMETVSPRQLTTISCLIHRFERASATAARVRLPMEVEEQTTGIEGRSLWLHGASLAGCNADNCR